MLIQGSKPPRAAQKQPLLSSGLPRVPALPAPMRPWCAWGAVGVGDRRTDIPAVWPQLSGFL